jgi:hypothetical protein
MPARPPQDYAQIVAAAMSVEATGPAANDTPPLPVEEPPASEEQGLADMAHRLETALRRPVPTAVPAPPVVAVPRPRATPVAAPPAPRAPAPSYENLQREMANLLGRQSGSS